MAKAMKSVISAIESINSKAKTEMKYAENRNGGEGQRKAGEKQMASKGVMKMAAKI
jgi:hypothetical protein